MIRKPFILIVAACLLLVFTGCKRESPREPIDKAPQLAVASVRVALVSARANGRQNEVAGTVEAVRRAAISAKVGGTIIRMPVVLGSAVKQGDLLVQLDAGEVNARLQQAEARLAEAKRNYEREKRLLEKEASTRETVNSLDDALKVAEAAAAEARTMRGYTAISAPFSGVVAQKMAQAGDMAMPGMPLLVLEDNRNLQAVVAVPEASALKIHRGDRLPVQVSAAGFDGTGVVTELGPSSDAMSRTTVVKLSIDDAAGLQPGQYLRLLLPAPAVTTLWVPESAVLRYGQMERLFTVEDNKAELRLVRTGAHRDGAIEILAGLREGEQVVIEGNDQLMDGQPVQVAP